MKQWFKKKENRMAMIFLVVIFLAIIGVSYAAFQYSKNGDKINRITSGVLVMDYRESDNVLSMDKALPTTDATGTKRLKDGEYFDFTASSTIRGNAMINWEIAAEDFSSNTFSGSNVRLYLTKLNSDGSEEEVMAPKNFRKKTTVNEKTGRPSNMMSLATGTMSASEVTRYRLRMYVDEDYNPQGDGGNKVFSIKVNVYGKIYEAPVESRMRAISLYEELGSDVSNRITSVVTKDNNLVPESVVTSIDVSENGDKSVMAYTEADGDNYRLILGGKGGVLANNRAVRLFANLVKVTSIDLKYFNTSQVTNMDGMFSGCSGLTGLDLSTFDTSQVTIMHSMFFGCSDLTGLDLGTFDTSQVTDMAEMFYGCFKLRSLDISNFDTSRVTDMHAMFWCCGQKNLNLTGFDTSNVTNMSYMFEGCMGLTGLDLSTFDTSQVTDMREMFTNCIKLTNLDLSSFDTSRVTSMIRMFSGCSDLTKIQVSHKWSIEKADTSNMFTDCGVSSVTYV